MARTPLEPRKQSQVRKHKRDLFSIFFNKKTCCVFSLELPHRGDSNEYTQYTICNIKTKITLRFSKSAAMGLFPRGKRVISVQATEWLLSAVCNTIARLERISLTARTRITMHVKPMVSHS